MLGEKEWKRKFSKDSLASVSLGRQIMPETLKKSLHRHPAHWSQLCIHYMLKDSSSVLLWIISEHLQASLAWICFAQRHAQGLKRESATVEAYDIKNGSKKSVKGEKSSCHSGRAQGHRWHFNRTTRILELIATRCCGCKIKTQRGIGHTSQKINPKKPNSASGWGELCCSPGSELQRLFWGEFPQFQPLFFQVTSLLR